MHRCDEGSLGADAGKSPAEAEALCSREPGSLWIFGTFQHEGFCCEYLTVVRASGADDDCAALYDEGCNGVLTAAWLFMTKVKLTCLIVVLCIVLLAPSKDFGRVVQFTV